MNLKKTTGTLTGASYIPYAETGYFSDIVLDYLAGAETLSSFYEYAPSVESVSKAIGDRRQFNYQRAALVKVLKQQYAGIDVSPELSANIERLLDKNTFTITTAHQPNIFTGPLYFMYKIVHAIKLAASLSDKIPGNYFVPVFFMGSEDADLDELGYFIVDGKKYQWKTSQTGAVGRMKIDKAFIALIEELSAQINVLPFGAELIAMFQNAYQPGETIQEGTLKLVNELFGRFGLIVLLPDNPALKKLFEPVIKKELEEQFSHKAVSKTIESLRTQYKVQAGGRELNLFYLLDDKRERIEFTGTSYKVQKLQLEFSHEELMEELKHHPERFSPNVILRGVFQETILPNVAFIGGGGEIAYWLELKKVFEEVAVPYPLLVLRNSFLLLKAEEAILLEKLGFSQADFFRKTEVMLTQLTRKNAQSRLSLSEEMGAMNLLYQQLHEAATAVDVTLGDHVNMLQAGALKRISELEKKMLRAEKKKFEAENRKIQRLKEIAFPKSSLQERVENFSGAYARYGSGLIDEILRHSLTLEQQFTIITV